MVARVDGIVIAHGMEVQQWTSHDDTVLREHYRVYGAPWCAEKLERTSGAIHTRACKLKIKGPEKNSSHVKSTEVQRKEIIAAYESGESAPKIVKRYPFKIDTVYKILRDAGVKRSRTGQRNTRLSSEQEQALCEAYGSGKGQVQLAKVYKISQSLVSKVLKKHGVKTRKGGAASSRRGYVYEDRKGRKIRLRSSWEFLVARILDDQGFDWDYEVCFYELKSKLLSGKPKTYTPDFWVYDGEGNLIKLIDVKGRTKKEQRLRIEEFKGLFSNLPFELWDQKFLESMGLSWKALHVPQAAVSEDLSSLFVTKES